MVVYDRVTTLRRRVLAVRTWTTPSAGFFNEWPRHPCLFKTESPILYSLITVFIGGVVVLVVASLGLSNHSSTPLLLSLLEVFLPAPCPSLCRRPQSSGTFPASDICGSETCSCPTDTRYRCRCIASAPPTAIINGHFTVTIVCLVPPPWLQLWILSISIKWSQTLSVL